MEVVEELDVEVVDVEGRFWVKDSPMMVTM
jgi:hypothetical protein